MKPKAAIAPAARAPRPYCCPAPIATAAAAELAVELGVELASTEEAVPDVVGVAVADAEEDVVVVPKVLLIESMVPQVSSISVLHAFWPVWSMG